MQGAINIYGYGSLYDLDPAALMDITLTQLILCFRRHYSGAVRNCLYDTRIENAVFS
jgi:hypothetical protein